MDDNTDLAEMYAIMLRRRGDTVTVATTAADALAVAGSIPIDVRPRTGRRHRRLRDRPATAPGHPAPRLAAGGSLRVQPGRRPGTQPRRRVRRPLRQTTRISPIWMPCWGRGSPAAHEVGEDGPPEASCTRPSWSPRQARADACDLQLYDVGTAVLRLVQHRGFPAAFPAAMIRVEQEGRAHGHREVR